MAWPTYNANVNIAGVTTIKWGTGQAWAPSASAIVVSADSAEEVEKMYIEQGDGMRATRVVHRQGHTWDFTIVDDSSVFAAGPNVGDNVVVTHFLGGGASPGNFTYRGFITDNNYRAARKQEGHRVLRCEVMRLIDTISA